MAHRSLRRRSKWSIRRRLFIDVTEGVVAIDGAVAVVEVVKRLLPLLRLENMRSIIQIHYQVVGRMEIYWFVIADRMFWDFILEDFFGDSIQTGNDIRQKKC